MIIIPEKIARQISSHGERTYPEECCGALIGTESDGVREVTVIGELPNSGTSDRKRRFLVSSDDYRNAENLAQKNGLLLLGFYHSHPDRTPAPSQYDLEHAFPWFSYVIQSVTSGRRGMMTAWVLDESRLRFDRQIIA